MIIFAPKEISRNMNIFTKIIARQLSLPQDGVENTLKLLDEGCTIPFISRYRKERTGGLNEVQIAQISDLNEKLKEMAKRKETILKTITELRNWRTSICPTAPSGAHVPRWPVNKVWSHWHRCCSPTQHLIPIRQP